MERDYKYYKDIFKGQNLPLAYVDLDLFDENVKNILPRAGDKKIRVASKSVRCTSLLKRVLDSNVAYQGLMCFTVPEAIYLSQQGFDDLLVAYPTTQIEQLKAACAEVASGKTIIMMVDSKEHLVSHEAAAKETGVTLPICMDIDMSSKFPGVHFGVMRSKITNEEHAASLYEEINKCEHLNLMGIMGYEAQIAGLGDNYPGQALKNFGVKVLKGKSIKEVAARRDAVVKRLESLGAVLPLVNGGGTGSLESTREESVVTEVTVGSGFYASGLFDNYTIFKHLPSAGYAIEIVRLPIPGIYTCHGGGYTASGAIAADKQPKPYLPEGAKLTPNEGAGEVQTPIAYSGPELLEFGDPVLMRHSKAGELCERFNTLLLISDGKIVDEVPTYRGEGQCFL
ncbi:MAG: amino acid deaminase/aldolase [Flavobacteriales bacterium]|nr:amino acid deaminase/aldolase [Flavobacteriales bacterium]